MLPAESVVNPENWFSPSIKLTPSWLNLPTSSAITTPAGLPLTHKLTWDPNSA